MIWLRPALLEAVLVHARSEAPREACGVLLGRGGEVVEAVAVPNAADDPTRYYRLEERAFVQAVFAGERRGLSLVGFYHSHPDGIPMPSQTDIAQSFYPDAVHLLVGLRGDPPVMAWRLDGGAERLALHVGDAPPEGFADAAAGSRARWLRQSTVILSAVVAFIILVVLSLALLPPAPRLPAP